VIDQAVVVEHTEGGDWALVLTATRRADGRRCVEAMIFANADAGVFAECPLTREWAYAHHIHVFPATTPEHRANLLKEAVAMYVEVAGKHSYILEHSRVGILNKRKAKAAKFDDPIPGFNLGSEPAFRWLYGKSESAQQAMRLLRFFIDKWQLGRYTQQERENMATRLTLRGY
jgi:hypothetical protein